MRLENLYKNFGESSPEEQAEYIASYRLRRAEDLDKIPSSRKKSPTVKTSKIDISLSDEEKAIMKMLGLKQKDIIALRATVEDEVVEDAVGLLNDNTFEEEEY